MFSPGLMKQAFGHTVMQHWKWIFSWITDCELRNTEHLSMRVWTKRNPENISENGMDRSDIAAYHPFNNVTNCTFIFNRSHEIVWQLYHGQWTAAMSGHKGRTLNGKNWSYLLGTCRVCFDNVCFNNSRGWCGPTWILMIIACYLTSFSTILFSCNLLPYFGEATVHIAFPEKESADNR